MTSPGFERGILTQRVALLVPSGLLPAVMPPSGTVRWYGWAPEQKKVDVYVGTSFVLSIFGSVPVKGITKWPPQNSNLGPGLKA